MSNARIKEKLNKQQFSIDTIAGLFTGVFCSGLFNPWDRALYLSVKNRKPFLSLDNFTAPYQGFSQAVVQRAFLGGIYFFLQAEMQYYMQPYLRNLGLGDPAAQFCIGLSAGSLNGVLGNPISAIKYHTWGDEARTFLYSVNDMWKNGGYKPFVKGTSATVSRDAVFGSTYEVLRSFFLKKYAKNNDQSMLKHSQLEFFCNSFAAGIATVVSGPFNYVRSMQYAMPPDQKPPTIPSSLKDLWVESRSHNQNLFCRLSFFQQRLRIGWGTLRVAVGMAVGQKVFELSKAKMIESYSEKQSKKSFN